jgi:hypothetical protein
MLRLTLIFLLFAASSASNAQGKLPIQVIHSGDDQVGKLYASELREAIRRSHSMRIVGDAFSPRIKIALVSVETETPDEGRRSAVGVTIAYDSMHIPLHGALLESLVHICGSDRVAFCAKEVVARIDAQAEYLRVNSPEFWKTLSTGNPR